MIGIKSFFNPRGIYTKVLLGVISLILCIIIYLPGLQGDFLHDDIPNIIENHRLHIDSLDFDSIRTASLSSDSGQLKRPISMFTFAVNHYYSQLNPYSYKLTNLIIHLLTGCLLFLLTSLLLNSHQKLTTNNLKKKNIFYLALFVSAAWLLSPINLSTVLYIVQRMTSLSALFSVAGLCLYVIARRSMIFSQKLNILYFLLSGLLFLLAVLSKENGALNIFYVICIEICFFKFCSNCKLSSNYFRLLFIFVTAVPLAGVLIYLVYNPAYYLNGYDLRQFTLSERLLTQCRIIFHYLKWIIAPNITELGLYHDDILTSKSLLNPITTLLSFLGLLTLGLISLLTIKTKPLLSFSILFFLCSHILESTIYPLEMVYEHRNYLASYGAILFCVFFTYHYVKDNNVMKLMVVVFLIWLCSIFTTTYIRSHQWKNDVSFSYYEALHHPKSARATFSLGKNYANLTLLELADEKDKAFKFFEKSMEFMPHEIIGESSSILFSSLLKLENKEEWVQGITKKLNEYPVTSITIDSLKQINDCIYSQCNLTTEQVYTFYKAALSNPNPMPKKIKSDLLSLYGQFSAHKLGDLELAYTVMQEAIKETPDNLQYRVNLAILLQAMNKHDQAEKIINYIEKNDSHRLHEKDIINLKKNKNR